MNRLKKYGFYFGLLCAVLLITSCKKDDEDPYLETWKQQNEKAFNDLALNPDFKELRLPGSVASIYYRVLQKGEGKKSVLYTGSAEVYYKGWFVVTNDNYNIKAGTVFDQRLFDDGEIYKMAMSDVIDGWKTALQYMVEGDKWEVWIPWKLGYRENGRGNILGYSTLAFEIELVKVID